MDVTDRCKKVARDFAQMWYARSDEGCDEATLAGMLEYRLEALKDERQKILKKFGEVMGL